MSDFMVLLQQLRKCSKSKCSHHNFLTRVCLLKRALFPEAALTATLNESHLENCMKMPERKLDPLLLFYWTWKFDYNCAQPCYYIVQYRVRSITVAFLGGAFVHSFPENGGRYRDCAHSQHKTLLSTLFFFICGG